MRRRVVLSFAAMAAVPAVASAFGAGSARITVRPAAGSATTRFVLSFRAPVRTGRFGSSRHQYILSASDAGGSAGACASDVSMALPPSAAHSRVRVVLKPTGRWCPGMFHGQIEEIQAPVCPRLEPCPSFVLLVGTIGRFSFRVRAASGDVSPPRFAGLQRAFACTPGPQRPGETTPFTLTWQPATDNVTPSSQLVYDVFMSKTPGGESFAKPTWTTPPGATEFRTPGLPSHGTFYFVVRARNQAGNEDTNTVERRGVDPCL